jgi:hypothetical protein
MRAAARERTRRWGGKEWEKGGDTKKKKEKRETHRKKEKGSEMRGKARKRAT